jgi:hypothetical protein
MEIRARDGDAGSGGAALYTIGRALSRQFKGISAQEENLQKRCHPEEGASPPRDHTTACCLDGLDGNAYGACSVGGLLDSIGASHHRTVPRAGYAVAQDDIARNLKRACDGAGWYRLQLFSQHQLRDGRKLHVRRPLVDLADLGVAPVLLDGIVLSEAVATVDLNRE